MTRAQGVDVSRWQLTTPSLAGRDFLIARATVGLQVDTMYREHIANARKAGLVVGAYAFTYDFISAAAQADAFMKAAGDVDLYFNDVEGGDKQRPSQAQEFHDRIRDAWGKESGLYMSESVFYTSVTVDYRWVANWTREPNIAWQFWQKRGSPLDLDEFHGTAAELRAFVGIPSAPESDIDVSTAGYPAPGSPYVAVVHAGTKLYTTLAADGTLSTTTRTLDAVRTLPYLGAPATGVRIVVHDGLAWYVHDADIDHPINPAPEDCSAEIDAATQQLKLQNAALTSQVTSYESRLKQINGLSAI